MIGRGAERAEIERLLAAARSGRSGALVLFGEPGVGKTELLGLADDLAGDARVLRASGVETEIDLAFAGLDQLMRPIVPLAERLPRVQEDALRGALGLIDHVASDRFLVGAATLSLLSEAADGASVLCLIDDAHWLDRPSSEALAFAARRLDAEGVVLLAATRDDPWPGVDALRIGGLGLNDAGDLLRERGVEVASHVLSRLVGETEGNALALVELAESLSEEQLGGRDPLPQPLPVTPRVEQAYRSRVGQVPEATRALLLVAATDDTADPAVVFRAASELGVKPDALKEAEDAGLVTVDGTGRMVFRHPLVRAAAYQGATFTDRRAAHRALAGALGGDDNAARRAWHLAATATGPDDDLAEDLARSAEMARRRGGHAVAASAYERAAELSITDADRGRFLVAAAHAAFQAGQADRAAGLVDRAHPLVSDAMTSFDAAMLRGRIEFARGSALRAHALLLEAAHGIAPRDAHAAAGVLVEAARAAWTANDPSRLADAASRLAELPLPADDLQAPLVSTTIAIADLFNGRVTDAVVGMREGLDAWQQLALDERSSDDTGLLEASLALVGYTRVTGDDAAGLALGEAAVTECRRRGWAAWLPWTLANLALTEAVAGRQAAARVNATEGLRLARDLGQPASICRCESILAWLAAVRGEEERCRELAADVLRLAEDHQLATIAVSATWALGLLELSLGHPDQAFDRLADTANGPLALPHFGCLFVPDLVEAGVRAARIEGLDEYVTWYEQWAAATEQPVAAANRHRCRALLDADAAEEHYLEALGLYEQAGQNVRPFDRARTQLLYGEWLRRARRRVEARTQLAAALETFQRLDAVPWVNRAGTELRATGQTLRRDDVTKARLTPQELQVVRMVAEGGSNQEVAAKLFLSTRTIAYHLYKAYPKLGVTSRAELASLDLDALLTT